LCGQIIVRHMCATGELSKPRPYRTGLLHVLKHARLWTFLAPAYQCNRLRQDHAFASRLGTLLGL
jgi:hypothetical protein